MRPSTLHPRPTHLLLAPVLLAGMVLMSGCGSDDPPPPVPAVLPEDGPPPTDGPGVPDIVAPERETAMGIGDMPGSPDPATRNYLEVDAEAVYGEIEQGVHRDALFFQGVLPCADCPGIRTKLTLLPGPRVYVLRETYLDHGATFTTVGRWGEEPGVLEEVPTAAVLRLDGHPDGPPLAYVARTDRETLRMLDLEGRWIDSDLPYELRRVESF